ncbi:MAG: glucan biosynthesis protein, partial [Verrucomicrobiales bacterium]|nr:glucan biosynthesis protein [Verrucomicrobiales bacterium]
AQVVKHPFATGWRVMLKLVPESGNQNPVDVRVSLSSGAKPLGETWTYLWSPPAAKAP